MDGWKETGTVVAHIDRLLTLIRDRPTDNQFLCAAARREHVALSDRHGTDA
jgi:hypothetical protein